MEGPRDQQLGADLAFIVEQDRQILEVQRARGAQVQLPTA